MKLGLQIVTFLFVFSVAKAFEVDNFTERYKPLNDSRDVMNNEVNQRLQKAADSASGLFERAANRVTKGANQCDSGTLHDEVYDEVGGWVIGSLEDFAEDSDKIQKHEEGSHSIYQKDGEYMVGAGAILRMFGTHSSVNLNGNYIGTDKFGHFFDQGYEYFQEFKKESKFSAGVERALTYGRKLEDGKYGLESTGVFSNADLVANYSGLQFWMSLTEGTNPYFKCVQGRWKMVRKFDFATYVNSGWDEAINCSKFRTSAQRRIEDNETALEKKARKNGKSQRYSCPVSNDQCQKLTKQYQKYATRLLSYECIHAQSRDEAGTKFNGQVPYSTSGSGAGTARGTKSPAGNKGNGGRR